MGMIQGIWAITATTVFAATLVQAQEVRTVSPDETIVFSILAEGANICGKLAVDGKSVIDRIPMSITIDGVEYPGSGGLNKTETRTIDRETVPVIPGISSRFREQCNETVIRFDGPVNLRVRVHNDGAAFRWESRIDRGEVTVNGEELAFEFADDYPAYYPTPEKKGYFSHQERRLGRLPISAAPIGQPTSPPVLLELDGGRKLLLTDVNVQHYPGLWIEGAEGTALKASFPPYPAKTELKGDRDLTVAERSDFLAKCPGTRSFPWRAFVVADDAGLLTSTMLHTLADPCRLDDTAWIKPGKVAWDWWNYRNITDMPFKAGINQETYKHFIDFAAANDLQYIILDEGWSEKGPDNLLHVVPALNIAELVEHGESKNVGVILWMTSAALEQNFDAAFEQFSTWGIKGIKVDFMQRDDQVMMDFCERIAIVAANHQLLVDFHGGSKPTGLQRTYPNVLTHESVLGLEQNKWSKNATPGMAVLLPFTRMVAGPMDYTPGAMDNYTEATFRAVGRNPGSQGTRCHQLAMYVVYLSPLQMLADTPTKYRRNPGCMPFLSAVPTTWDETVVLHAEVGKAVAVARRKGDTWYIGAMTDWTPRELECKLGFLGNGDFQLNSWKDGPNAATEATDTTIGESTVDASSTLTLKLAPGGGYAAIIKRSKS
ncbi:Retaining alpha-galactosidase [Pontiella desulfatans]|uniref:Retaining alpha-galactosidase n=1 Tax=Pontiella desulfatans TaxID=2750659 RepID=A0A6C2U6C0_PONDE|nr:glycoside hydrolase family 97 protein [Pontiella desulfatans]VGO15622.1 Retaining alpha-galactosidase [Pontiella desulfatans]